MFEQKIFEELIILLHGGIICPEKKVDDYIFGKGKIKSSNGKISTRHYYSSIRMWHLS